MNSTSILAHTGLHFVTNFYTLTINPSLVQNAKEELSEEAEDYVKWMDSFQPNRRKYYEPLRENTQTLVLSIE